MITGWIETPDDAGISGFCYNAADRTLEVRFKRGRTYFYLQVPETIFEEMQAAPAKGKFITERVKNVYNFQDKRDQERPPSMRPKKRERFNRR